MPTYQQKNTEYEGGVGTVTEVIRISDTDTGLLLPESEVLDIDILEPGTVEEQLENKDAALVEDAFSFTVSEAAISNNDAAEVACLQLLRTAIDPDTRVFVAVFMDAPDPVTGYTIDQAVFAGDVSHDQGEEDLYWLDGEWGSSPAPVKSVSFENKPLADALFDDVKLEDIIMGVEAEGLDPAIEGITNAWMDANVENKTGWLYYPIGGSPYGYYVRYHMLCPLNKVLRKLSDLFESHSERKTGQAMSVVFDRVVLDGEYIPARIKSNPNSLFDVGVETVVDASHPRGKWSKWYGIDTADKRSLAIDPDAVSPDDEEQINIDFKQISYGLYPAEDTLPAGWYDKFWNIFAWELNEDPALAFQWKKRVDTFGDLLYGIAYDLGLKLKLTFDDATTVRVSFVPFSTFVRPRVYLKDAEKASLDIELVDPEEYGRAGFSCPMALDGKDLFTIFKTWDNEPSAPLEKKYREDDQKKSLLTLSPTRISTVYSPKKSEESNNGGVYNLMLNSYKEFLTAADGTSKSPAYSDLNGDGTKAANYINQAIIQTSAIYLNVKILEADKYHDNEPLDFYAPACKMVMNIDGEDREFEKLSDYSGFTRERTARFSKLSKKLSVPYLHGFSLSSDGSSPHWSNIRVGSEIVLDSITYMVMKVTRNLAQRKTELELVTVELASEIAQVTAATAGQSAGKGGISKNASSPGSDAIAGAATNAIFKDEYELGEDISKGKHVWLAADTKIYESRGEAQEYGRGLGIILRDGLTGELREVLELGDFIFETAVLIPGSLVYLRKDTGSGYNVSHTPLTEKDGTEVLYKELGIAQTDKILSYRPGREGVHL